MSQILDDGLEAAARRVREYGLSDVSLAWVRLCDALLEIIKDSLLHAPAADVPGLQAQARQLQALQEVARSKVPVNGRA